MAIISLASPIFSWSRVQYVLLYNTVNAQETLLGTSSLRTFLVFATTSSGKLELALYYLYDGDEHSFAEYSDHVPVEKKNTSTCSHLGILDFSTFQLLKCVLHMFPVIFLYIRFLGSFFNLLVVNCVLKKKFLWRMQGDDKMLGRLLYARGWCFEDTFGRLRTHGIMIQH